MIGFHRLLVALFLTLASFPAAAAIRCDATGARAVAVGTSGRTLTLHRPDAASTAPLPLVILLHGSGSTGAAMLRDSALAGSADRHGFLVVAPDAGIAHEQGFV